MNVFGLKFLKSETFCRTSTLKTNLFNNTFKSVNIFIGYAVDWGGGIPPPWSLLYEDNVDPERVK